MYFSLVPKKKATNFTTFLVASYNDSVCKLGSLTIC